MRQYVDKIKHMANECGVTLDLMDAITIARIEASKADDEIDRLRQAIVDRNRRIDQHKDLELRLDAEIKRQKELNRDLAAENSLLRTEKATLRDAWLDWQVGLRMFRAVFGPLPVPVNNPEIEIMRRDGAEAGRLTRDQAFAYYALARGVSVDEVHISDMDVETLQSIDARLRAAREGER
ncbi:MAG: hypothetical protein IPO08_20110 [Xanthomonadales bacterium]|nr:hypothetical protein [Xanthomonadales bacterium]